MQRGSYSWRIRREPGAEPAHISTKRLRCSVCGFPGVDVTQEPGARLGQKPVVVTGTLFVGVSADAAVTTFDSATEVQRQPGECPHCGAERFLDGSRGSGLRRPV